MTVKRDLSTPDSGIAPIACTAPLGPWAGYRFDARHVFSTTSPHQRIDVVDLPAFGALGRAYRLDARFMASLADAHICHECMVHPLLLAHGAARRVLVLGGGDGGSAREILRHERVCEVVVAELDAQVPATIRQYMPALPDGAFDDPRTRLIIGDARDFVDAALARGERFDAVIFDLTEADGAAAPLHDAPFFGKIRALLAPGGGVALQLGAPWFDGAGVRRMCEALRRVFRIVTPMTAYVPLYGTLWALAIASDTLDVRRDVRASAGDTSSDVLPQPLRGLRHFSPARMSALLDIAPELAEILGENGP